MYMIYHRSPKLHLIIYIITHQSSHLTHLTGLAIQVSTLIGISGTFIIRLFLGPIAEAIGVRRCMAALLISCFIPGFALAGASTAFQVYAFRFFAGEFSLMLPLPRLALEHQS
jgi:hypothetical protein